MTLVNQTPVPRTKNKNSEDFFEENIFFIIIAAFLIIALITVFLTLFTGNKKIKKPTLQFIPFYVQR